MKMLPDKELTNLLEKYIEKSERYKHLANEEHDRTELKVLAIQQELKNREDLRKLMK